MFSPLKNIAEKFHFFFSQAKLREAENRESNPDLKLLELAQLFSEAIDSKQEQQRDFLLDSLNLLHLKIAKKNSIEGTKLLKNYLTIEAFFQNTSLEFSPEKRLNEVPEGALEKVILRELEPKKKSLDMIKHSSFWYALAEDSQILDRQVYDLKECSNISPLLVRIQNMFDTKMNEISSFGKKESLHTPWIWQTIELSIGKFLTLTIQDINKVIPHIDPNACKLYSDSQNIQGFDFNILTGDQIESLLEGDHNEKKIKERFELLKHPQLVLVVNKTSGKLFNWLPIIFFKRLSLSEINKEKLNLIFNFSHATEIDTAKKISCLSEKTLSANYSLLPEGLSVNLTDQQIRGLNYAKMSRKEINDLFTTDTHKIALIPKEQINVLFQNSEDLVPFLTKEQYEVLNVGLLTKETVQKLFPAFSMTLLFPNQKHTISFSQGKMEHIFKTEKEGCLNTQRLLDDELEEKIEITKMACLFMGLNFTKEQLTIMKPMMYPEVQNLFFSHNF